MTRMDYDGHGPGNVDGNGVVDIADLTQIISKVGSVIYTKPEK